MTCQSPAVTESWAAADHLQGLVPVASAPQCPGQGAADRGPAAVVVHVVRTIPGGPQVGEGGLGTSAGPRAHLHRAAGLGDRRDPDSLGLGKCSHGVGMTFSAAHLGLVLGAVVRRRPLELVGPSQVQLGEVHQVDRALLQERQRARLDGKCRLEVWLRELVEPQLEIGVAQSGVRPAPETLVGAGSELNLGLREVEQRRLDRVGADESHRAQRECVGHPARAAGFPGELQTVVGGLHLGVPVPDHVLGHRDGVPERRAFLGAGLLGRAQRRLPQGQCLVRATGLGERHHPGGRF